MSGETKEVLGSNYGQNDVIINRLIDKMTLFDDNLMSLVFGQNIETTELLLRVIMERDIKVIEVRGQDEIKKSRDWREMYYLGCACNRCRWQAY